MNTWKLGCLLALAGWIAACNADLAMDAGGPPGNMGATPGGTQDMQMARELVEQGRVPPPEAFLVEGMFSEHDLPVDAKGNCASLLCLAAATGVAPNNGGDLATWVQLGLSSTVDPNNFDRPSLAAVFVIDVSGSMGYEYPGSDGGGAIARTLAHSIVEALGDGDWVNIVTFDNSAYHRLDWSPATDPAALQVIDGLATMGGTNFEAGLTLGYQQAASAPAADETRVILITDAQPNVGSTEPSAFDNLVAEGAAAGVGITVIGTAIGLNIQLMDLMAQSRGGNAFTLQDSEEVPQFMEDNWPWMVSPIAYDFHMAVEAGAGTEVVNAYGFPGTKPEDLAATVSTVFLSKNRGALLLELGGDPNTCGVTLNLSYEDLAGSVHESTLQAHHDGSPLDGDDEYYPEIGVHKAVALALLVTSMRDAAEAYGDDPDAAIAILTPALARFGTEATQIGDADIDAEAEFWPQLLTLMQDGAPQGDMYPY